MIASIHERKTRGKWQKRGVVEETKHGLLKTLKDESLCREDRRKKR